MHIKIENYWARQKDYTKKFSKQVSEYSNYIAIKRSNKIRGVEWRIGREFLKVPICLGYDFSCVLEYNIPTIKT